MSYYFDPKTLNFYPLSLVDSYKNIDFTTMKTVDEQAYQRIINGDGERGADVEGNPILIARAPSKYHTFDGKTWVLTASAKQQRLSDAKREKLQQLNNTAEKFVAQATQSDKVPDFERATWAIQRAETLAWFADNNAPTPTLDTIAQSRGINADMLRQKAYKKSRRYQAITASAAGQRQGFEDAINNCESIESLAHIDIKFTLKTKDNL